MGGWKEACEHRNSTVDTFARLVCGDCGKIETHAGWVTPPVDIDLGTFEIPADLVVIRELTAERDALKAELAEHEAHWSPIPTTRSVSMGDRGYAVCGGCVAALRLFLSGAEQQSLHALKSLVLTYLADCPEPVRKFVLAAWGGK